MTMVVSAAQAVDVTQALASVLCTVDGLRVYPYVADSTRPPAAVVGQPDIDFADPESGFCFATFTVPITIITTRANDRDAQADLSRLVWQVATALRGPEPPGVFSVEPQDARPIPVQVSGQELPGYLVTVRVRA
jgi:hypothetical protein